MANQIRLKRASGSDPGASDLVLGEPAVRTDTGEIFLKKDDGSIAKVAGGIDDGDKGDITVSNDGGTFTIDNDAVTYAKIQNVSATNRILGRDSSGAGVIEEITPANLRTMINVENGATADQSASEILTLLKTVDGSGSGLDADTLDGVSSGSFVRSDADDTLNGQYTISDSANEKLVLAGSNSPLIRFQEGTTNKAYIQWNNGGFLEIGNQESNELIRLASGSNGLAFVEGGSERTVYHTGNLSVGDGGLTQNNFTNADHSKLDGIEAGATADQSASEILTLIKTVDGSGSGLDADTLDGVQASGLVAVGGDTMTGNLTSTAASTSGLLGAAYSTNYFGLKTSSQTLSSEYMIISANTATYISASSGHPVYIRYGANDSTNQLVVGSGNDALTWRGNKVFHAGNDGAGSGLDADSVDGIAGSSFLRSDATDSASGALTFTGGLTTNLTSISNGILELKAAIATSHTITTDYNALAVDPTINNGVTVTVPSGAVWAIV